jgi:hypothetical protein
MLLCLSSVLVGVLH